MLTPQEAFRAGFLMKCAADGLTPAQTRERVERAAALLEKLAGPLGDNVKDLWSLGGDAMRLGLAAPVVAGTVGGYLAHRLSADDLDEDDVRKRELIEEMRHFARQARERQRTKLLHLPA